MSRGDGGSARVVEREARASHDLLLQQQQLRLGEVPQKVPGWQLDKKRIQVVSIGATGIKEALPAFSRAAKSIDGKWVNAPCSQMPNVMTPWFIDRLHECTLLVDSLLVLPLAAPHGDKHCVCFGFQMKEWQQSEESQKQPQDALRV